MAPPVIRLNYGSADLIPNDPKKMGDSNCNLSNIRDTTETQSVASSGQISTVPEITTAPSSRKRIFMYQLGLVLLASTSLLMAGSILAFPSVIVGDLLENNSTIFGTPMSFTSTQQDLLGSITSMGALVGVWAVGLSMGPLGRVPVFAGLAVTGFVSWIAIGLAPNPGLCLLFRALSGVVYGGVSVVGVAYIVEITDDNVRGSLTLLASGSITFGQVISVVPAYWLRYYIVTFVNCLYPTILFLCAVFILPESPTVLVMKGQDNKARKTLEKLRGADANVEKEIEMFKDMNKQHQDANVIEGLRQRPVLKRLGIVCILFVLQVFSGYTIFVAQTARIIMDSGGTVEASIATILVQSAQLVGLFLTMTFVKRLGRRGCLLLSHCTMAAAVGALALFTLFMEADEDSMDNLGVVNQTDSNISLYQHFHGATSRMEYTSQDVDLHDLLSMSTSWLRKYMEPSIATTHSLFRAEENTVGESSSYGWVPLLCIMLAQFGSSFGVQNVPFILSSEYFPTAIRPQAASICVSVAMLLGVVNLQLYTPLQQLLTQTGLLFLHCAVSLFAIPFTYFFVIETVGKKVG